MLGENQSPSFGVFLKKKRLNLPYLVKPQHPWVQHCIPVDPNNNNKEGEGKGEGMGIQRGKGTAEHGKWYGVPLLSSKLSTVVIFIYFSLPQQKISPHLLIHKILYFLNSFTL